MHIDNIFRNLDLWVSNHGTGRYVPEDFAESLDTSFALSENFGIQQVRKEIYDFVKILKKNKNNICVEIGLGFYGSTHFLFRHIFDTVITLEYQKERVLLFRENLNKFYNKFILNDKKSKFIFGDSSSPSSLEKLISILKNKKVDLLFIDGDHNYKAVLADFLLYKEFVKNGGIIAFHDCVNNINNFGVNQCLKKIKEMDKKNKIYKIIRSKSLGIAYIIKK